MKSTVSLIMAIVLLPPALNGQKLITNTDKPANPNPGRVIIPQKIMEISGDTLITIEQDKDENWMISKYKIPFTDFIK